MGIVDVGFDEASMRGHGSTYQRTVQPTHRTRTRYRVRRPSHQEAHPIQAEKGDDFAELDFTYYNAVYTVENALTKAKDEKGLKRVARFLKERPCSDCGGTRLSERARQPRIRDINLAQATAMSLDALVSWVGSVPESLEPHMHTMASAICESFLNTSRRLLELGLGYLSLDRAGATLSTGERQRVQLARAVRNRTTGVLYVLDEPSIGLHPANVDGLLGVMRDLVADGNSVVVVDHDTRVLAETDYLIEMGPGAGAKGGQVIAQGTVPQVIDTRESRIAPFLAQGGNVHDRVRDNIDAHEIFSAGRIHMETDRLHTVGPLSVDIPRGRLTAVTGVSGSGKTTMVLEMLMPALQSRIDRSPQPTQVRLLEADGVSKAHLIDATPIGANIRSTVATYCGVHDDLRRAFAKTDAARTIGLKAGHSPITLASCVARRATARDRFRSTCSSCLTSISNARHAMARGIPMQSPS